MLHSDNATSADNQQVTKGVVSDEYFAGFTDGEGCFYVGFSKRNDLPLHWQVITEFHVSQNPGGKNLLEAFKQRLDCGYIKLNHPHNLKDKSWVLVVKNRRDLNEKVIPFFQGHPLYTVKQKDFVIFAKVLSIIEQKRHVTKHGFKEIIDLVFSIQRMTKKRYSKEILLRTSETIC